MIEDYRIIKLEDKMDEAHEPYHDIDSDETAAIKMGGLYKKKYHALIEAINSSYNGLNLRIAMAEIEWSSCTQSKEEIISKMHFEVKKAAKEREGTK